jgi:hypothetical protein
MKQEIYRRGKHEEGFAAAQRIVASASNVKSAKESRWSEIVKNDVFGELTKAARHAEGQEAPGPKQIVDMVRMYVSCFQTVSRLLPICNYLPACNREDEDLWNQGGIALEKTTPHDAQALKRPKPDLYIALPVIHRKTNPKGFHKDDYIQFFTENFLGKFEELGMISNPITRMSASKDRSKHFVCFPSTIIEIKPHGVQKEQVEYCYCQAANGAAAALSMLHQLSSIHSIIPEIDHRYIRPVVAFTFIGWKSRVWIAFIKKRDIQRTGGESGKQVRYNPNCKYVSQISELDPARYKKHL